MHFKITTLAKAQLELILENDSLLRKKKLRVTIQNKGCSGFTYSVGFDNPREGDIEVEHNPRVENLYVIMDKFTAFYCKNIICDYLHDIESDSDGFSITNQDEEKFQGKFWKEDQELIPHHILDNKA